MGEKRLHGGGKGGEKAARQWWGSEVVVRGEQAAVVVMAPTLVTVCFPHPTALILDSKTRVFPPC